MVAARRKPSRRVSNNASSKRIRGVAAALSLAFAALAAPAASAKPVLTYGTFLGSTGYSDNVNDAVVDAAGNLYVVGRVDGVGFPITEGAYQAELLGGADAYLAKFDAAGELVFATYFGGTHHEGAESVALGPDGSIYISGATLSADLPVTADALQSEWRGNVESCEFVCFGDGFIARFSNDGSQLLYSTFLGGDLSELVEGLLVDDQGRVYASGFTTSVNFPTTTGAFDEEYNTPSCFDQCDADAFVARLNANGSKLDFSTYFGGTSWDSVSGMGLDAAGNIYIGGGTRSTDLATTPAAYQPQKLGNGDFDFSGFVASFSPDASDLLYATYLGKRAEEQVLDLAVAGDGTAWATGFGGGGIPTTSDAIQPRLSGRGDAFAVALVPDGSGIAYGTFLGGRREESGRGIALMDDGRVLIAGSTASDDLATRRALQPRKRGMDDLFFARFRPGASRFETLTYLGGEKFETSTGFAMGAAGAVYLTGASESVGMPLAGDFAQRHELHGDGVVMRLEPSGLVRAGVRPDRIEPRRVVGSLGRATFRWRNLTGRNASLVETGAHLVRVRRRAPGSDYYFSFPAGRFVITDPRSRAIQRIAVAPLVLPPKAPDAVVVRWAKVPLPARYVYDVQVAVDGGSYETWKEATSELQDTFTGPASTLAFRARVSNVATGETTAWSPPALLSSGG